jgi:hypothetical protein
VLIISYGFFILIGLLYYITVNEYSGNSIVIGIVGSVALTLCLLILGLVML